MKKLLFISVILLCVAFQGCKKVKKPEACFTYEIGSVYFGGAEVSFTNCSTDADHYKWDLGEGHLSTDEYPAKKYYYAGTYTVTLTAYSSNEVKQSEVSQTFTVN